MRDAIALAQEAHSRSSAVHTPHLPRVDDHYLREYSNNARNSTFARLDPGTCYLRMVLCSWHSSIATYDDAAADGVDVRAVKRAP